MNEIEKLRHTASLVKNNDAITLDKPLLGVKVIQKNKRGEVTVYWENWSGTHRDHLDIFIERLHNAE